MKIIPFFFYYLSLRLKVLFGLYATTNPLGIGWRWKHWHGRQKTHRQLPAR